MDVERELINYGFDEKEAKVYLALMQLGKDSAFNIARRTELKRSTVYVVLEHLIAKGMVGTEKTRKALLYFAAHPKKLLTQLENKKKNLEESMPSIMALYNAMPEKPSIQIYDGLNALKELYIDSVDYLKSHKEVVYFGSMKHFERFPELLDTWLKATKNKGYHVRELFPDDKFHREYATRAKKNANPNHQIRFITKDFSFLNDNSIYGNKLIIYSTQKEFFALVIESGAIAKSYLSMFELAWSVSKK